MLSEFLKFINSREGTGRGGEGWSLSAATNATPGEQRSSQAEHNHSR